MSEIILKTFCQGYDCPDRYELKNWICGGDCKGQLYLSEKGIVRCDNCNYKKDILSMDFICTKCREKNPNSYCSSGEKYKKIISSIGSLNDEGLSDEFIDNLLEAIRKQRHTYKKYS